MPIARFEMPDGRIARFEVPEGTTPEQANSLMVKHFESPENKEAPKETSIFQDIKQGVGNLAAGVVRGAGSIGSTILAPYDMAKDAMAGKGLSLASNRQRRNQIDAGLQSMGAEPDSAMYQTGKLAGEIAGTAGTGSVLGNAARLVAPGATNLANALTTGGFRGGNMLSRIAGGAATGGASAGLVDPSQIGTGAAIGGALPPALSGAGKLAGYAGRSIGALAQPFTNKGQDQIAGRILNKFSEGGPITQNMAELVPGSSPTLAEATGNAGIARLQNSARDIRPNAFVERETANSAARNAALDNVAGDANKLEFFKADRSNAASDLYKQALDQSNMNEVTPYIKGQVTQLLKRPSINAASKEAQKLALERGEKPAVEGSLQSLHDVKTALDDNISVAVRAGKGGEAKSLQATKDKLLNVMEKLSPEYGQARVTYAEMSAPVNQMEALQGLKLTDSTGNITLSKIQNALDGLHKRRGSPGIDAAKSLTDDQINTLSAIRDDLLRKSSANAGKSAGSNTFQNIATDNIISTMLPGKLGGYVSGKAGGLFGQVGQLAYSKPNEAIRNKLVDMMLDPSLAQQAMNPAQKSVGGVRTGLNSLSDLSMPYIYRSAPVLSSGQ